MPSDSNFPDLPPSPLRDDDKFIVNRDNVSHKINASDFLYYFANVEFPVTKPCDADQDCPPGYICYDGKCVLRCDGGCDPTDPTDNYSCCPEGQICVQVDSNTSVCLPYPFNCGSLPIANPCPDGFVCIEGLCLQQCGLNGDCPPGHICANIDGLDVCVPYPFPCPEDGVCPQGFECYNGFCLKECSDQICPPGSQCIQIEIEDPNLGGTIPKNYCVPYPFPCGSLPIPTPCPDDFYCYGGMCYPICQDDSNCPEGFECFPVGNENNNQGLDGGPPISICLPSSPAEGLINDGKLNIVDDQNNRRIIFTANQYGDTFLKFNGIDIEGGNGGGSGSGDLSFRTLWKRVNVDDHYSDIQPTYEDVNVLPNGLESNIGFNDGTEWKSVYSNSLRNVSTSSDHLATGDTSDRPTNEPEGAPIGAGEIRYNTDRQSQPERFDQSQHDKDLEVYNGSGWVRMNPKTEAPLYDDNYETRLIYGRGLTTGNSGANPTGNGADAPIVSWAGYKTYNVPQLEAKIGRGLRFSPDSGAIEQYSNVDDDILVSHQPYTYYNNNSNEITAPSGGEININLPMTFANGSSTLAIPIPNECNRALLTIQHRLLIRPESGWYTTLEFDVHDPVFPFSPSSKLDFDTFQTREHITVPNTLGFAQAGLQPLYTYTGRNVRNVGGNQGNSMTVPCFMTNMFASYYNSDGAVWTGNTAEIQFDESGVAGGTTPINLSCTVGIIATTARTVGWDRSTITVEPYEYKRNF